MGNRWGIQSKFFIIPVIASILIFGAIGLGLSSDAFAKQPKVDICHVDPDNDGVGLETLNVSIKSVQKHLAHGDFEGPCLVCGDGTVDPDETCDDGANNGTPGFCNATCDGQEPAVCGDGIVTAPETCDDGNTVTESCNYSETSCTVCASDCSEQAGATSFCGDSNTDSANGETCDDGASNGTPGSCNVTCNGMVPTAVCGNGITEAGETCDDGEFNGIPGFCNATCDFKEPSPDLLVSCMCNSGETIPVNLCIDSCQGALEQICEPLCLLETEGYAAAPICTPSWPFCANG